MLHVVTANIMSKVASCVSSPVLFCAQGHDTVRPCELAVGGKGLQYNYVDDDVDGSYKRYVENICLCIANAVGLIL